MRTGITTIIEKSEIAELISTAFEVPRIRIADIIFTDKNTVEFCIDGCWNGEYQTMTVKELHKIAQETSRINTNINS